MLRGGGFFGPIVWNEHINHRKINALEKKKIGLNWLSTIDGKNKKAEHQNQLLFLDTVVIIDKGIFGCLYEHSDFGKAEINHFITKKACVIEQW